MNRFLSLLFMLAWVYCGTSCYSEALSHGDGANQNYWSNRNTWYPGSMSPDADKVDVFYLVSTEVVSATDSLGKISLTSLLTTEDTTYINMELEFVKDSIFGKEFNFISPYYHQYTFDSFTYYPQCMDSVRIVVGNEVREAFDYYMMNVNNGRRFILAGYSQGGDMVMQILRRMTQEQYSRMVAAYVMGFKITAADTTNYATIHPAKGETDTGVVVTYNSVLKPSGIWNFVAEGTVACINPVNWRTDTTPAEFSYNGETLRSHIDQQSHLLVVDADPTPYHEYMHNTPPYSTSGISEDCLHHWDILFYDKYIHKNALKRAKLSLNSKL